MEKPRSMACYATLNAKANVDQHVIYHRSFCRNSTDFVFLFCCDRSRFNIVRDLKSPKLTFDRAHGSSVFAC